MFSRNSSLIAKTVGMCFGIRRLSTARPMFGIGSSISARVSKRVAFTQDFKERLDQDLDVQPEAPIIDIPEVHFYSPRDLFDRGCRATEPVNLRPSRHPGFDVMTERIILQYFFKIVGMSQRVRPRSDKRHLSPYDVHELWQFVNACGAQ